MLDDISGESKIIYLLINLIILIVILKKEKGLLPKEEIQNKLSTLKEKDEYKLF